MKNDFSLYRFIRDHRLDLFDVAVLSFFENVIFVAQFYFIGQAVNQLLEDSYRGIYVLFVLYFLKIIISYFKQIRVSKAYEKVFDKLIVKTVGEPMRNEKSEDLLLTNNLLAFQISDFFKTDLIKGFETVVRLLTTFLSLFLLNKTIFAACLVFTFIVFILFRLQKGAIQNWSRKLTDELKRSYSILVEKEEENLYRHHERLNFSDKKLSGISARNFAILEFLSFGLIILSLIFLVESEGESAFGTFFTMLYYVFVFIECLTVLPLIYQKYLRIQEMKPEVSGL